MHDRGVVHFSEPGSRDFDIALQAGQDAEGYVADAFRDGRLVEVKLDAASAHTPNLYVETHCRYRDGDEHESGLLATKADYLVFVLPGGVMVWVPIDRLRQLALDAPEYRMPASRSSHPTRGRLVRKSDLFGPLA